MQSVAPPQQQPQQRDVMMEQHIQQTNERLLCIQQYLENPTTFASSAKELLDWCKDVRAFQRPFEPGLMGCLTVVHQVASAPGYDLNLAYRLMVVCSSHRDKLSPKSSSLLSSWFEELSHLLFLRQSTGQLPPDTQLALPPQPPGGALPGHSLQAEQVTHLQDNPQRANTVGWQNTPVLLPPQPPSVSVVTTVWEVTNGSGAPQTTIPGQVATPTTSVISAQMTAQPQQQQRVAGATVRYQPMMGDNSQTMYGGMHPPMPHPTVTSQQMHPSESQVAALQNQQPGNPGYGQGPAPAAAAAAAAVAAAAATATATATAHATAQLQEQQERQQAQQGQQGMGGPQQGYSQQQYYPRQYQMQQPQPMQQQPMGYAPGFNRPSLPPQQRPVQYAPQQQIRQYAPTQNPTYSRQQPSSYMYPESSQGFVQGQPQVGSPGQMYAGNAQQGPAMTPDGMNGPGFPSDPNRPLPPSQLSAMQYGDRGVPQKLVSHRSFPNQYPAPDTSLQINLQQGYMQSAPGYPTPQPQSPHFSTGKPPPGYLSSQPGQPSHYPASVPQQMSNQMVRRGSLPPYPGQGQSVPPGRMMAQHESVAGTPTHPYMPTYPVPTTDPSGAVRVDLKPNPAALGLGPDEKPGGSMGSKQTETARLSFPVRDGTVLMPFRLQHNLSVSNHVFLLKEQVYKTLITRSDLELQFKCYHHEDRLQQTNWPAAVSVNVNAEPVPVERGDGRMAHKPLYIKTMCQVGKNTIQIAVTACCCSHLFVLQLVHRPSINSVLQSLLKKRLLGVELCIDKIRSNFAAPSRTGGQDGVEQTSIKVSLKCPLSFRRISFPARGRECRHVQCFDLESYLQLNCERGTWKCPVCLKPVPLELIEVDQFIWGILTTVANSASGDVEEVMIDPNCQWKPVLGNIKQEPEDDLLGQKRRKLEDGSSAQMYRQSIVGPNGPGTPSGNAPYLSGVSLYNTSPVAPQHGVRFPPDYNQAVSQYTDGAPRPAPPSRFPPPYPHSRSSHQMTVQHMQQTYGPPPQAHHLPHGQSGVMYSSMPQSHTASIPASVKATGSGRNTPNMSSGFPMPISDPEMPISSTNPGTPQVESALEGLTMCSDNPGSNAPRSNISVNGAHVLSVQNFPADDQLDLDIFETLNELGDLSDENELLKLFDSTVN